MWCVIPSASRKGYHPVPRGQSFRNSAGGCDEGCRRDTARSGAARRDDARTPASERSKSGSLLVSTQAFWHPTG